MPRNDRKRSVRAPDHGSAAMYRDRGLPSFSLNVGRGPTALDAKASGDAPALPAARLDVSQPGDALESEADRTAGHAIRRLAAAPGGAPPPPPPSFAPRMLVQRASLAEVAGEATGLTRGPREGRDRAGGLLVDDETQTVSAGQMKKTPFLDELRRIAGEVADRELRTVGRTADGCPYLDQILARYATRPAAALERSIRRYAPEARGAGRALEYLGPVATKLGRGVAAWATTGRMPDLPLEVGPSLLGSPAEATPGTPPASFDAAGADTGAPGATAPLRAQVPAAPGGVGPARKKAPGAPAAEPESPAAINAQLTGGQPLTGPGARVAGAFDDGFSDVRIHTDPSAARLASRLGARAFTIGSNVAFASGEYAPGSPEGDALLAHELTHVLQQRGAPIATQRQATDEQSSSAHEDNADRGTASALSRLYRGVGVTTRGVDAVLKTGYSLQRCKDTPKAAAFAPALGTKATSLKGTFGDYTVDHGLTKLFDAAQSPPWGEYKGRVTMKPNAKTGGHDVAFIQTWRQKDVATGARVTAANPPNVTADEAKRIDPKTGMAVDRADPAGDKTPFFGMSKSGGGLTEFSTAHKGKSGGDDAFIEDKPGFNDPYEIEFTTTATDMTDGTPYDAVCWGFKYDSANKVYTEITPFLVTAGSEQMAARDRAYKKWNDSIATTGSGIDPIAIPFDPVTTAITVQTALTPATPDAGKARTTLLAVTDADKRARVRACYEVETGRKLKDDLTAKLSAAEQKGLEAWTK